jgi:hypothetical protein
MLVNDEEYFKVISRANQAIQGGLTNVVLVLPEVVGGGLLVVVRRVAAVAGVIMAITKPQRPVVTRIRATIRFITAADWVFPPRCQI